MSEEKETIHKEEEIDIVKLTKTIWGERRFIIKVTGVFAIIGLTIAFTSPVEYKSSCKLLPENQEGSMPGLGGLDGLAGLAGIDLGGMSQSNSLSPQLYPEMVNSLPFILDVMNDTIYFEQIGLRTTSFDYFENIQQPSLLGLMVKYTIGLPGVIKKQLTKKETPQQDADLLFYRFSKEDWERIEKFKERVSIIIEDETGLISITVEMPDPYAAAQLTNKIEKNITKSVIKYKTDKANQNLSFITDTFEAAKTKFQSEQVRLARATDRNINVSSASGQIELRRIENEYNVAFEVYKGLASQVEQAKIQLKEDTPVFTVLEPVRIPEDNSKPNKLLILIAFLISGLTISFSYKLIQKRKVYLLSNHLM